jgi:hypothetical protein
LQAPRDSIAAAVELVCDSAMYPDISSIKLAEVMRMLEPHNNELVKDPLFMASEGVVSAAYSGGLARPTLWTGAPIHPDMLAGFHSHVLSPSCVTCAAVLLSS